MQQVTNQNKYNLEERTAKLAEQVILLCKSIKLSAYNRRTIEQLIASSGSIGANYCEANESESKKDFIHKIGIAKKEIKSTSYTTGYSTNYDSVLVLGSHNTSTSFYTGILDEVKIYNSALSAEQVRQDMNAGSTLAFGGVAGNSEAADMTDGAGDPPIAYWDFEEASGTSLVSDKSGSGQIDDVQIYNYALSASQVKKLYNQNSAIRFGP